ncbi:MAG: hypothetical protein HXX12_00820 [Geothrix sp.]|uniref:hypothetical protein n=1 Tax=Geothrix sp. TaxID=1962974 RepID=UPI0018590072|nr:hypothetical protein [Geothrix sp.]NWJ39498.1 hypothetical protein [Geothrix sp.]WIL19279.1 MAG: hypothetical protein QOZ81_001789 [Geothrix sp.]
MRPTLLLPSLLIACSIACESTKVVELPPNAPLFLEVIGRKHVVGQPVLVKITLQNTSQTPIMFNSRMILNSKNAAAYARELSLVILNSKGVDVPFTSKLNVLLSEPSDYKTISPKASYAVTHEIAQDFSLSTPGTYSIKAYYKDGCDTPPKAPAGTKLLTEELESNIVKLTLHSQ